MKANNKKDFLDKVKEIIFPGENENDIEELND